MEVLGIDIGGTGIKGAPVNTETGKVLAEHFGVLTPHPATPEAVSECVVQVAKPFDWKERIGWTFQRFIKKGVTMSAANLDEAKKDADPKSSFEQESKCEKT